MPAAKLRPVRPSTRTSAAGHVLAAVVADALDHRGRPRVAHAEALPHLPADEDLAGGGAVEDDVAGDDLVLGGERRTLRGPHDEPPARQALAEVVIGVAVEAHRDSVGHEGAEALARRPGEGQRDGVVGRPAAP